MDDDEVIKVPLNYIGYKRHKSNTMDFNNLKHRAHVSPEFSYHVNGHIYFKNVLVPLK